MGYYGKSKKWLGIAENLKPNLCSETIGATRLVQPIADTEAFQGWRMEGLAPVSNLQTKTMKSGDVFYLDFGAQIVGYLSFDAEVAEGDYGDSPLRLRLIFCECPAEATVDPYSIAANLNHSWFQEEIINIDMIPQRVTLPRRYAFRYLKVEALCAGEPYYSAKLHSFSCDYVSSAGENSDNHSTEGIMGEIEKASVRTLKNCMQTVFEDGPKRDRRLWLGDLRLEALANYKTFKNYGLVKRCLYLFSGLADEEGFVPGSVFEKPILAKGGKAPVDYAVLFGPTLLDYFSASKDKETAAELLPVALRQFTLAEKYINEERLFKGQSNVWVFIDWANGLYRDVPMQGVLIYSLKKTAELARQLGQKREAASLVEQAEKLSNAALTKMFNDTYGLFVDPDSRQLSLASQTWMVLAGVINGERAVKAMRNALADPKAVPPGGPYMYHHVIDAMVSCGMKQEARGLVKKYWGAMVERDATTFWEVYDPQNDFSSPYGNYLLNSYCHAWSCTPVYFIRSGML